MGESTTVVNMFETGHLHLTELSRAKTVTQVTVCSFSPLLWEGLATAVVMLASGAGLPVKPTTPTGE